ncbi:hypothetical protein LPJ60_003799 [Coemansia sp. RSA 2675]|nr:hypothetical protein LPJ60_003799 [Coemansia sp. RSA 2675]
MADSSDSDQMADPSQPPPPLAPTSPASKGADALAKKTPAKCQACTNCRQKKIKCDGSKPTCSACLRNAAECQYVPSRRRGRPARAHREYERPYANPLPILPRQPRAPAHQTDHHVKYHPPLQQLAPNRVLPTLPHLQPALAGQGTMPPPPPTAPPPTTTPSIATAAGPSNTKLPPILPLQYAPPPHSQNHLKPPSSHPNGQQHRHHQIAPLGSILAAALFPGSPNSLSEDDVGPSGGHRSSGSESPLPPHVRPPPFLVPGGDRGGHQTMAQATPLVIPRPSMLLASPNTANANMAATSSYIDPNIIEFFHYFNALYPIVHWPSFKEAYDDGTVPNYLILAIRALSKRYSKQPSVVLSGQLYSAGQDLAAIASSLAEVATREDPNTYLIQTWIVLSMFEFGMGRIKQAADRRELAVRLAYKLELSNIEVRASQRRARSLIVAENCRRVWWTLFYADRYFSLVSSDPEIGPAIHESTYRVGFPRAMREATPPPMPAPQLSGAEGSRSRLSDVEFPRYDDHDVILWFQSAIPLSLIMGHLAHQCRAAEQLFRNGLAARPTDRLWEDAEWLAALTEFTKSFLVIDAEIAQWRQQLNAATTMHSSSSSSGTSSLADSPEVPQNEAGLAGDGGNHQAGRTHSTRDVTLFHRELQYQGLVIIHQCLALYAYEKLRLSLSTLASACTSLLWLESTATQAWKKVVRAADVIRSKTNARATELANARASVSGTMANGAVPEPEWELCAPHMPFILYLSAKVHMCQYHWQKIALARTRADASRSRQHHASRFAREHQYRRTSLSRHAASIEPQVAPSFVQPFSQPASAVGTPTSSHEGGWATATNHLTNGSSHQPVNLPNSPAAAHAALSSSAPNGMTQIGREANTTPVMTTSGAAALAAAQAAAAQAAASSSSRHTTPQRSRGGSATHLNTLGMQDGSASGAKGVTANRMDTTSSTLSTDSAPQDSSYASGGQRGASDRDDGFQMNVDDEINTDDEDVESKLARRVQSSQARLEMLLQLLATCQEYWADHDYVQLLRDMLNWPDEWTTSMQMLERLLLELRID